MVDRGAGVRAARPDADATGWSHVPGLDGLRGAAVVAVVAYHLDLVPGGFLGVDVFFVLSGFLITSLLLAEADRTGRVDLRDFWRRRVRRLVPAVLVMTPVVIIGALATGWPRTRTDELAIDGFATLTWWANWRQAGGASYWAADDPNLFRHAWSLAVEEQFYLVWPIVVLAAVAVAVRGGRSLAAAIGAVAGAGFVAGAAWMVVLAERVGPEGLGRVYVGTDTRVFAPLAGCVLACWWHGARRARAGGAATGSASPLWALGGLVGIAVLGWLVLTAQVFDPALYRGGFLLATVAAVLVVVAVLAADVGADRRWAGVAGWTEGRVLRHLGLRSYGIYLWSWPLQVLAEQRVGSAPRPVLVVGVVTASLVVAEASFRWVEEPVRRRRGSTRRRPLVVAGWSTAAVAALVPLAVATSLATEPPAHERLDRDEALAMALASPTSEPPAPDTTGEVGDDEGDEGEQADEGEQTDGGEADEVDGPTRPTGAWRVMVFGDSLAFTAAHNQQQSARPLPDVVAGIDNRALLGCGVLAVDGWEYWTGDPPRWVATSGACERQTEAEAIGLRAGPDLVLGMPGAWEHIAARPSGGERVEPLTEEMAVALRAGLVERSRLAHEHGASFGLVAWACPGPESPPEARAAAYVTWINEVIAAAVDEAVALGHDAFVIEPTDVVCEGGDVAGPQTPQRAAATDREYHLVDADGADWFWHDWIGPALADLTAG